LLTIKIVNSNEASIDVSRQRPGTYFARIVSVDGAKTEKFVKQ